MTPATNPYTAGRYLTDEACAPPPRAIRALPLNGKPAWQVAKERRDAALVACLESLAPELRIMAEWTHSPLSDEYAEKYRKCMDTLARAKENSHDAD